MVCSGKEDQLEHNLSNNIESDLERLLKLHLTATAAGKKKSINDLSEPH